MSVPGQYRVLVLAADPLARSGLAALLSTVRSITVCGLASDRDDLGAALAAYLPDVLLWDLGWDPMARLEAMAAAPDSAPPILALVADVGMAAEAWSAGARGVLDRECSAELMAAAVAALCAGLSIFRQGSGAGTRPAQPAQAPSLRPVESLTPREMEVLRGMADGLSNKLIARQLAISEHTVKFHINSILGKLDAQSRTDAVVRATRAGLLLL